MVVPIGRKNKAYEVAQGSEMLKNKWESLKRIYDR
jgi:hypothetical protein